MSFTLTPGQQGILYESMISPIPDLYVNQHRWLIDEKAVEPLVEALALMTRRHEVLRSSFELDEAGWRQTTQEFAPEIRQVQLPVDPLAEPAALHDLLQEIRLACGVRQPAPYSYFTLVRLRGQTLLAWTYHHVLLDGWSVELILNEIDAVVTAQMAGDVAQLRPAVSWGEVVSQADDICRASMKSDLSYWRNRLEVVRGSAAERWAGSDAGTGQYHEVLWSLPHAEAVQLKQRIGMANITMATLCAGAVALARSLDDPARSVTVIGGITAGRPAGLRHRDDVAGLLAQVIPVAVELPGDVPIPEWLHKLQRQLVLDREHATAPLWDIQQTLGLSRSLFDTGLAVENFQTAPPWFMTELPTRWREVRAVPPGSKSNYTYSLAVVPDKGLDIFISTSADQVSLAATELFAERVGHYLRCLAESDGPLTSLAKIPPGELQRVIHDWNDTAEEFRRDRNLGQWFTEQAAASGDAVAVECKGRRLTYVELERCANQLGHHLRSLGVGPGSLVGVVFNRGFELVVAMLAVWKAGGGYLPIDPGHPRERMEFMVEDASLSVMLTAPDLSATVPDVPHVVTVDLLDWSALDGLPRTPPAGPAGPSDIAQVLYTSGSTGRPKGVLLEHRNLARYLHRIIGIEWGPDLRTLHYSPISFDAQTYEIWAALLHGGTVVMADDDGVVDAVRRGVLDYGANAMWMASSFFNAMVDSDQFVGFPELTIAVGGEPVSAVHVAKAYHQSGKLRLVNIYGPTECSVKATTLPLDPDDSYRGTVPIGRPLPNVRAYVLSENLEPLPVGAVGELCLAGEGVARGYLNRPDLTRERFLADPFHPGERMYRTGDLVRWTPEGLLDFVGRLDDQVKVRGFRIELGEIESALKTLPDVGQACVIVREDEPGDRRLVAYVVPQEGRSLGPADEMRAELQRRVPDYMLPAHIMVLSALPQTTRGKLDRSALPPPSPSRSGQVEVPTASDVSLEGQLAQMCAEVLDLPQVGQHEDFMELGGHSLLLMRLLMMVKRRFGLKEVSVALARAKTVATMAEAVREELDAAPDAVGAHRDEVAPAPSPTG